MKSILRISVFVAACLSSACGEDADVTADLSPSEGPEPTATATVTPDDTRALTGPQLLVLDGEGLWLMDLAGEQTRLDGCPWGHGAWNPAGDRVLALCSAPDTGLDFAAVFDIEGLIVDRFEGRYSGLSWSPTGAAYAVTDIVPGGLGEVDVLFRTVGAGQKRLPGVLLNAASWEPDPDSTGGFSPDGTEYAAYRKADAGCAPGCTTGLVLLDTASGAERTLGDRRPLAWVLGGKAILAGEAYNDEDYKLTYKAVIVDVEDGSVERVDALDDGTQFWLSPDGSRAAFAIEGAGGRRTTLAVIDFRSKDVAPIEGARLDTAAQGVPPEHVAMSADGFVYWVGPPDLRSPGRDLFRARLDGSERTKIGGFPGFAFVFAPDFRHVAHFVAGDGAPTLMLTALDGSPSKAIREQTFEVWWRP